MSERKIEDIGEKGVMTFDELVKKAADKNAAQKEVR